MEWTDVRGAYTYAYVGLLFRLWVFTMSDQKYKVEIDSPIGGSVIFRLHGIATLDEAKAAAVARARELLQEALKELED
jgi:hypothetical protein